MMKLLRHYAHNLIWQFDPIQAESTHSIIPCLVVVLAVTSK